MGTCLGRPCLSLEGTGAAAPTFLETQVGFPVALSARLRGPMAVPRALQSVLQYRHPFV